MPSEIHWPAITLRLALTIAAGGLLGVERSRTGHAAGLCTTLLVTLAASVAMIQMNLLIQTNGKPPNSYVVMDLMRLPLGILTGVGFIGAGTILRKNELILGVTTAAALWFATVVGLCMGEGQVILGSVSTVIGVTVLWGLRGFEKRAERYELAELKVVFEGGRVSPDELKEKLQAADFQIKSVSVSSSQEKQRQSFRCELRWPSRLEKDVVSEAVKEMEHWPGVLEMEWNTSKAGPQ